MCKFIIYRKNARISLFDWLFDVMKWLSRLKTKDKKNEKDWSCLITIFAVFGYFI